MKKVIFKKLIIKNFLSVGNIPVEINFRSGLHGITGVNRDQIDRRNGVGKSTIPDAVHFALFGTTIRELKKEFITNNITGDTCEVSLTFDIITGNERDSYEVVRTIDPSKCILYHNDKDITRDSITNTTDFITQLIQCNSEVFQNCVVMTVNNTVPFMAKKKTEKRKFIEGIFNLEVFSRMLLQLRDEASELKRNFDTEKAREEENIKIRDNLVQQQKQAHSEYESRKTKLTQRKQDNDEEINEIVAREKTVKAVNVEETNKNINLLNEKLKENDLKIQDLSKQIATLETKNDFLVTTVSKIGTEKDVCPTCLKAVTDHDTTHIKQVKKQYKQDIEKQEVEIVALEAKVSNLNSLKIKINDAIKKSQNSIARHNLQQQQSENDKKRFEQLKAYNIQVEEDLKHLTDSGLSLVGLIAEAETKILEIKDKVDQLQKGINLLDTVKFVVSEEGVKSFIVKRILNLFNSKIAVYLKKLHSNAVVSFNEYFEEQIINDKGKLTTYFNFSGAERKAIDLAVMFSFIDMLNLQGNVFFNVQFYDELLDTSLDETGVELVLNLLNEFVTTNGFGIYIVSHRKECARFVTGDLIRLEKNNGITTLAGINS